jgi:ABC-type Fe3+-hydroxamate transport system substrate-binding protein
MSIRAALAALALATLAACATREQSPPPRDSASVAATPGGAAGGAAGAARDDFGVPFPTDTAVAARIVSLNPTVTEVLFAIGAADRLVGRTRWDEFPAEVTRVPSLGDGIRPNVEAVLGARPTLVLLYATAENRPAADAFRRAGIAVVALRVDSIAQFMRLTDVLGAITGERARARTVRDSVAGTLQRVRSITSAAPVRTVVWPAWHSPVMVIGGGSFLDEIVQIAGGRNVFHDSPQPSPQVSVEEIARRDPALVIASAETEAKLRAEPTWRAVRAVRDGRFARHDPAVTGRPSVVLGMAAVSIARALHPELAGRLP